MIMQSAMKLTTTVLPGRRIEFSAPELIEGEEVELIVMRSEQEPVSVQEFQSSLLDFLHTVPPGPRPYATWDEYDRALQEEKDAWES